MVFLRVLTYNVMLQDFICFVCACARARMRALSCVFVRACLRACVHVYRTYCFKIITATTKTTTRQQKQLFAKIYNNYVKEIVQ